MSDFINRPQTKVLSTADGVRRRQWSDEDKVRIVEKSFLGHRQAAATSRRYGICRSLLTIWHRQYRNGELGGCRFASFSPVPVARDGPASQPGPVGPLELRQDCQVETALPNGRRLIVPTRVEPEALARILAVVEQA